MRGMKALSRITMQPGYIPRIGKDVATQDTSTRFHTGTGEPTTIPAGFCVGDLYLDTATQAMYKVVVDDTSTADPKDLKWERANLFGGSVGIHSGSGDPAKRLGNGKDLYYKTDAPQSIWEKKLNIGGDPLNQDDYDWVKFFDIAGGEWLSGAGDPTASDGQPGDKYFKSTVPQTIWEKKLKPSGNASDPADYEWEKFFDIKGGSDVFSGAGDPANTLGNPNDLYFKEDFPKNLWQKKLINGGDPTDPADYAWEKIYDFDSAPAFFTGMDDPNSVDPDDAKLGDIYFRELYPQSIWQLKDVAGTATWTKIYDLVAPATIFDTGVPNNALGNPADTYIRTDQPRDIYVKNLIDSGDPNDPADYEWEKVGTFAPSEIAIVNTTPNNSTGTPFDLVYRDVFPRGIWQKQLKDAGDASDPADYEWKEIVPLEHDDILLGATVPTQALGLPNSKYYRMDGINSEIYVKKLVDAGDPLDPDDYHWELVFKAASSDILSGEQEPDNSIGNPRDIYFKTDLPQSIWQKRLKAGGDPDDANDYEWVKFFDFIVGSVRRYEAIGDGVTTEFVIEHSMGTKNVIVQAFDDDTGSNVIIDIERTDEDTVTLFTDQPIPDGMRLVALISDTMTSTIALVKQPIQLNFNVPGSFALAASNTVLETNKIAVRSTLPRWELHKVYIRAITPGAGPNVNISIGGQQVFPTAVKVTGAWVQYILDPVFIVEPISDVEISTSADATASGLAIILFGMASNNIE